MIQVVPTGDGPAARLPESAWRHVSAQRGAGHALQADGLVAENLVRDLLRGDESVGGVTVAPEDLIVISPFRAMASVLAAFPDRLDAPGLRAGTVHTAQGQEATVVVFVLGGDPAKPGARTWASATPNLVHVAASRAKRRLYVISDCDGWGPMPNFNVLAAHLPRQDVGPSGW